MINKDKRILFIVPPCVTPGDLIPDKGATFINKIRKEVPLGVLSLATYVNEAIPDGSEIIDFNVIFYNAIYGTKKHDNEYCLESPELLIREAICGKKEKYKDFKFGAISAIFTPTYEWIKIISDELKVQFPDINIITGGGVPTNMPEEILDYAENVDIISSGEGEIGIRALAMSDDIEKTIYENSSLTNRKKLKELGKESLKFQIIENLDEIPPLDFSLIELGDYNSHAHSQKGQKVIAAPLMFSRGCPFKCCFCASHSVHGRNVRYNSLKRIKDDVLEFVKKYKINTITVWDDNFFVNKNMAMELLSFFKKLDLVVEFVNGFPVYRMDDDMANMLKLSGVETITLAIESGNDRVLRDIIHKPLKVEMVSKAVDVLRKYDFYIKGLFVIGFPGETLDDIKETMDFINKSKLNWVDIYIASPLPGSELYDICKEKGYLKGDISNISFFGRGKIETEDFKAEDIEKLQIYNMLKKDYVFNQDMKEKRWERALYNFEYVINANHKNPFAYYYAAIAAYELGKLDKTKSYIRMYKEILDINKSYKKIFDEMRAEGIEFLEPDMENVL